MAALPSWAALKAKIGSRFPDNRTGEISAEDLREIQTDQADTAEAMIAAAVAEGGGGAELPPDYDAGDSLTNTANASFSPADVAEISDRVINDSVSDWAHSDNSDPLPRSKLTNAPSTGGSGLTDHQAEQLESAVEFEAALRSDVTLLNAYAITTAFSNTSYRVANQALPSAETERELEVRVGGDGTASTRFDLATLAARPTISHPAQLSAANSQVWEDANGDSYYLAHAGNGQLYFSADNPGSYTITLIDSRLNTTPYVRELPIARTTGQLPAARVDGLPSGGGDGQTAQEVAAAIQTHKDDADAHHAPPTGGQTAQQVEDAISARLTALDSIYSATFTAAQGAGQDAGNVGIFTTLPTNFAIDGTRYHVEQVFQTTADNDLWIGFDRKLPDGYAVQINTHKVALKFVQEVGGDFRYLADGAAAGTVIVGANTITIYEPLTEENFVPGGGNVGQVLEAGANGTREWANLPIPRSAINELWDRHTQGIAITNAGVASRSNPFVSTTPFVIGDKHGLVFVAVEWRIVSPVNMQLGDDRLDSFTETLTDLRSSTAYSASAVNGIRVGSVELQATNGNRIGAVDLYLAKNASDQIIFWLNHVVDGGTSSQTATSVQAVLSISVFEHDAPASSGGGGGGATLVATATGNGNNLVATGYTLPATGPLMLVRTFDQGSGRYLEITSFYRAETIRGLSALTAGTRVDVTSANKVYGPDSGALIAARTSANELLVSARGSGTIRVYTL